MSKSSKPHAEKAPAHPDALLIEACMDYAIALHGMSGAFGVDPTADCDFANARDTAMLRKAATAAGSIENCRPSTLDGLRAKASAIKVALDLDNGGNSQLVPSLVDDIARFHRAIVASNAFATTAEIAP